jgi:hypothetical protein
MPATYTTPAPMLPAILPRVSAPYRLTLQRSRSRARAPRSVNRMDTRPALGVAILEIVVR